MGDLKQLKEEYWKVLCRTRKSGRIAQTVKDRVEGGWDKFDEDVVMEALRIHMSRYPGYKESYTVGIMRNLQKRKGAGGRVKQENKFNQFEQHDYDFAAIQKALEKNVWTGAQGGKGQDEGDSFEI